MELTEGRGADVVVEVVGKPEVVNEGIRMLARGGRYLELGNINPKQTYKADPSLLVGYNRSIIGISLYPPMTLKLAVDFLARTKDRYPYEALLSHAFSLDEIDKAFNESDSFGGCGSVVRASIVPGKAHHENAEKTPAMISPAPGSHYSPPSIEELKSNPHALDPAAARTRESETGDLRAHTKR